MEPTITTADITPALADALRGRYTVSIMTPSDKTREVRERVVAKYPKLDPKGRIVVLQGKRKALYGSVQNVNTGYHLFIDRPVEHLRLAILEDGRVGLALEAANG